MARRQALLIHLSPLAAGGWLAAGSGHADLPLRRRARPARRDRHADGTIVGDLTADDFEITIALDLIHVVEYLWKAAYVFHPEGSREAEAWVSERLLWLLCGDAGQVIASIRRTATCRGLGAAERKPADTCANYIEHHKAYVHYDTYLAAAFPIATGVIEGACR